METVALIASIFSIALAILAIWQANHHRDQSDKLNRDTTEKLARIEAFATSIKEDAFGEIKRYGDFWRAGGKGSEEIEKAKEDELRKLKDEIRATTSTEINKVLQTVESKLSSSAAASTISDIRKEFEELKKEIAKIQDKAVAGAKDTEKRMRILSFMSDRSSVELRMLREAAEKPGWKKMEDLDVFELSPYDARRLLARVDLDGLLKTRTLKLRSGEVAGIEFDLDEDLKEALLR